MFGRIRDHANALGLGVALDKLKRLLFDKRCNHSFEIHNTKSLGIQVFGKCLRVYERGLIARKRCYDIRCSVCNTYVATITGNHIETV